MGWVVSLQVPRMFALMVRVSLEDQNAKAKAVIKVSLAFQSAVPWCYARWLPFLHARLDREAYIVSSTDVS